MMVLRFPARVIASYWMGSLPEWPSQLMSLANLF